MDASGLEALTAWCEEGLEVRSADTRVVPGTERLFETFVNGRRVPEGATYPEGAPSASGAIAAFEAGWTSFREGNPGRVLYWRVRPCWVDHAEGFRIRCRAAIV